MMRLPLVGLEDDSVRRQKKPFLKRMVIGVLCRLPLVGHRWGVLTDPKKPLTRCGLLMEAATVEGALNITSSPAPPPESR